MVESAAAVAGWSRPVDAGRRTASRHSGSATGRLCRGVSGAAGRLPAAAGGDPPADASDPDNAAALARLSGGAAAVITLGRRFPHGDSCWLELFADAGYERVPFMWAADGERAFRAALAAQADAFADAVRGGACRGATAEDAVAALAGAERLAQALGEPPAGGSPA
jgi:predicted dehydrogenase